MKPVEMLEQEAATVLAFGGNVQVCENPLDGFRSGDVVPWRMKRLGEFSRFLHRRRTLAASIPQVAILHSEHHFNAVRGRNGSLWGNLNPDYLNGAVFSLLECHYAVDIMDEWALLGGVLLLSLIYREKFNWAKLAGVGFGLAVIVLSILRNGNN